MAFRLLQVTPTTLWLPAGWQPGYGGMQYPAGVDTSHLYMVKLPSGWQQADIVQMWSMTAAGGNIAWQLSYVDIDPGFGSVPVTFGTYEQDTTYPGAFVVADQQLWSAVPMSATGIQNFNLTRLGADAADTAAGTAILYGLTLERTA